VLGPLSRSRSVSPRKRQLNQDAINDSDGYSLHEGEEYSIDDDDDDGDDDDDDDDDNDREMEIRGRPRKRSWGDESTPGLANSFTTASIATSQEQIDLDKGNLERSQPPRKRLQREASRPEEDEVT